MPNSMRIKKPGGEIRPPASKQAHAALTAKVGLCKSKPYPSGHLTKRRGDAAALFSGTNPTRQSDPGLVSGQLNWASSTEGTWQAPGLDGLAS